MSDQACNWCGFFGEPIQVHGSYLCPQCRNNINPCCSGETVCEPKEEEKKGFGYDSNHLWVIEMRTSLKWLPVMPPRAFDSLQVAYMVITDMTGRDYEEVLFCDYPEYRITEYLSSKTNEFNENNGETGRNGIF